MHTTKNHLWIFGIGIIILFCLNYISGLSKAKDIDDWDDDEDVHYIDWDEDLDEDHNPDEIDESDGADDYYSSRPWIDE